MSINIYWRSVAPTNRHDLYTLTPLSTKEALQRAFGDFPLILRTDDVQTLRGMAATWTDTADSSNPYEDLIAAIDKHEAIEVWGQS